MSQPTLAAVDGALHGTAKPYGFAITVWLSGEALTAAHGGPSTGSAFLFAAGAIAAFGLLRVVSARADYPGEPTLSARKEHLLRAGTLHVAAIMAGGGAAALIALVDGGVAWPLGSFAAVLAYLLVTSIELRL